MKTATKSIRRLIDQGRLVVFVEATQTLHEVTEATQNGGALQLHCPMGLDEKRERLLELLMCNLDVLPEGEMRRLVVDLHRANAPVYWCEECNENAVDCDCGAHVDEICTDCGCCHDVCDC